MLVWNYRRNAIVMDQLSLVKSAGSNTAGDHQLLLSSNHENYDPKSKEEEEAEEGLHASQI